MRSTVGLGAVFAFAALAGCVTEKPLAQRPVVVDYYAGTTDLSGYPGMGLGASTTLTGNAGARNDFRYQPLNVRRCNSEMTECSLGLLDLTSQVTILEVGPSTAKVQVVLGYQVGKEVRHEALGTSTVLTLPPDVNLISDKGQVTRSAEIPYGAVRSIELPYGAALTLCISPPGVSNMDPRPCAESLRVRDPSVFPAI